MPCDLVAATVELLVHIRWNQRVTMLNAQAPRSKNCWFPNVGTNASQSWNLGFPVVGTSGSQTLEHTNLGISISKHFPNIGTDVSPFPILELRVPNSMNQRFRNIGTNASQSWNHGFAVLGTTVLQTKEPMLPNLGTPRFRFEKKLPVSQRVESMRPKLGTIRSSFRNY